MFIRCVDRKCIQQDNMKSTGTKTSSIPVKDSTACLELCRRSMELCFAWNFYVKSRVCSLMENMGVPRHSLYYIGGVCLI